MDNLEQYFETIYNQTYDNLLKFAVSKCKKIDDVHDILQNVYSSFYRRILSKGHADIENPTAFLVKLAKNELSRHYGILATARNLFPVFSKNDDDNFDSIELELNKNSTDFSKMIEDKELIEKIFVEIKKDELTAKIFTLFYLNDMKIDQIAEILDVPQSTIKNKLYRTLKKIREKFPNE